jgi:hypothetical protein
MKKINILSESELRRLVKKTINEKLLYEQAQTQPQDYTIQQLQNLLNKKGYNVGTVDGKAGQNTLKGINAALSKVTPSTTTGGEAVVASPLELGGKITPIPTATKTAIKSTTVPTTSGTNAETKTNQPAQYLDDLGL